VKPVGIGLSFGSGDSDRNGIAAINIARRHADEMVRSVSNFAIVFDEVDDIRDPGSDVVKIM
jgi:hypothetical protein